MDLKCSMEMKIRGCLILCKLMSCRAPTCMTLELRFRDMLRIKRSVQAMFSQAAPVSTCFDVVRRGLLLIFLSLPPC